MLEIHKSKVIISDIGNDLERGTDQGGCMDHCAAHCMRNKTKTEVTNATFHAVSIYFLGFLLISSINVSNVNQSFMKISIIISWVPTQ